MKDPDQPRKGSGTRPYEKHGKSLADIFRSIDEEEANEELAPGRGRGAGNPPLATSVAR